jgi:hypothetical protein
LLRTGNADCNRAQSRLTHSIGAGSITAARSLAAVEADLVGWDEGRDAVLAGDVSNERDSRTA